jgi:hypothetical protein
VELKHGKYYTVKRSRLLQFLKENGFTTYKVIPDPTSTKGYNWFLFTNTPELEECLEKYFSQFK